MLSIIKSQFLQSKLTILRNKNTSNSRFRRTMDETSYLIAADVLKNIPFFLPVGDGAAVHVGADCTTPNKIS